MENCSNMNNEIIGNIIKINNKQKNSDNIHRKNSKIKPDKNKEIKLKNKI